MLPAPLHLACDQLRRNMWAVYLFLCVYFLFLAVLVGNARVLNAEEEYNLYSVDIEEELERIKQLKLDFLEIRKTLERIKQSEL